MVTSLLTYAPVGLSPVLLFLGALVYFDSYKLLSLRAVLGAMLVGAIAAGISYFANSALMDLFSIEFKYFIRYVSPVVEEALKAAILVYLIRTQRIGLLVDAAIVGFAIGTGFAVVENIYYLLMSPDTHMGVWFVRGFGTALMHGGASAIFAIVSVALSDEQPDAVVGAFGPGLLAAVVLHSAFNHFLVVPVFSTLGIILLLPPAIYVAFQHSENSLKDWLGDDFDADVTLMQALNSEDFAQSKIGVYLHSLREKFHGPVVGDMLCYLHLHVELALRAKGVLLARESGIEVETDQETLDKLAELEYLERSIGKTGQLAMQPILLTTRKDLWQFYVLKK